MDIRSVLQMTVLERKTFWQRISYDDKLELYLELQHKCLENEKNRRWSNLRAEITRELYGVTNLQEFPENVKKHARDTARRLTDSIYQRSIVSYLAKLNSSTQN